MKKALRSIRRAWLNCCSAKGGLIAPTATAAGRARFARLGLIDRQGAALELSPVQHLNGRFTTAAHLDKTKTADRPVSRSLVTWARLTVPWSPNSFSRSSVVVVKARFPTYRFMSHPLRPIVGRGKQALHRSDEGKRTIHERAEKRREMQVAFGRKATPT